MSQAEVFGLQRSVVAAEDHGSFDDVLKFAHVAGPTVFLELPQRGFGKPAGVDAVFAGEPAHEFLRQERHILAVLDRCNGNRTHAAKLLDISIRTLRNKLHEYHAAGAESRQEALR